MARRMRISVGAPAGVGHVEDAEGVGGEVGLDGEEEEEWQIKM